MAEGFDELGLGSDIGRVAAAVLFIQSSTNAFDVYSALNSSPWTSESFGGDPAKAASCRKYVNHSLCVTAFYSGAAALLARSIWPIIGWAIASAYMWKLYDQALKRAAASKSQSWDDAGSSNGNHPAPANSLPWSP